MLTAEDPSSNGDPVAIAAELAGDTAAAIAVLGAEPGLVLLIEDDFVLRTALAELLRSDGYRVEGAADGLEALARLQKPPKPSLVILDIMLPHMNGRQFRDLQLGAPALADIPLVVITAMSLIAEDQVLLKPDRVFYKPLETAEFLTAIRRLCPPIAS